MKSSEKKKARAELLGREWVEFEIDVNSDGQMENILWKAWGCHQLLEAAGRAAKQLDKSQFDKAFWTGSNHWDILISEVIDRLQDRFHLPITDAELCHCRKILTSTVDQAIVLGAHTPAKVTTWTRASSGCGTCRPDVEKLIAYRLK